jgi:nicotinamidase/pyrazinamidase
MNRVFVDVDTLNDFFADGALPVPNADKIRPVLKSLTVLAKNEKIPVLKLCDCHDGTEPEMICNGGPFPLHCMKGTEGAACIRETANNKAIVFEKRTYDVFDKNLGNPDIVEWLMANDITEAWVYGDVGNICVEAAVIGLLRRNIKVYVFENAVIWMDLENGIFCQGPDNKEQSVKRMIKAGAHMAVAKL